MYLSGLEYTEVIRILKRKLSQKFPTSDSEENINNIEHIIDSDEEIENLYD